MIWIYPVAVAIVVALEAVLLVRRHVLPWWKRRRTTTDQCEVCGKWLRHGQVRELREDASDDAELDIAMGGTYMVATYCRRHFPPTADRSDPRGDAARPPVS